MSRKMHRLTTMFLVLLLILSMAVPVSAEENPTDDCLGGHDNLSGYIVPDGSGANTRSKEHVFPSIYDEDGIRHTLVIYIEAKDVTDLLVSIQGNKSFTLSKLPGTSGYLSFKGTLYHPLSGGAALDTIKYGVCHYNSYTGKYDADYADYLKTEESASGKFKVTDYLSSNVTYYTFVKNVYQETYIYGDLAMYYSAV